MTRMPARTVEAGRDTLTPVVSEVSLHPMGGGWLRRAVHTMATRKQRKAMWGEAMPGHTPRTCLMGLPFYN